jgi:HK97 family phage major capsid protein
MNLSERIQKLSESIGPLKDQLKAQMKTAEDLQKKFESDDAEEGDENLPAMLAAASDEIVKTKGELDKLTEQRDNLLKFEKSLSGRAAPATPTAPNVIKSQYRSDDDRPGMLFAKMHVAAAIAYARGVQTDQVMDDIYGEDEKVMAVSQFVRQKAGVVPATTTGVGWAAELVRNETRGYLDTLRTTSIGAAIATRSMVLDFGSANSVTVPRRNAIGLPPTEPAWVGEGGVIPLQQFSFGATTLNRYKLASITPYTEEIAEQSIPQIETLLLSAMDESYTVMLDTAVMSAGAAVGGIRPAGLLNGVTPLTGSAAGGYEAIVADMKAMMTELSNARLGTSPLLILNDADALSASLAMNPLGQMPFASDMASGTLLGVPFIASQNQPLGRATMVDCAALATAFGAPQIRMSSEATLTMADAGAGAPTQADDGSGALGTAGQVPPGGGAKISDIGSAGAAFAGIQAVSLFQTASMAIRGIWPTSWGAMRPGLVSSTDGINWA